MTRQRSLVYEIVCGSSSHPTAEEVFAAARERMPSIARATIYNNLNALAEQGAIRRVKVFGRPDCFDRSAPKHDHLICDRCGKLSDAALGDLINELSAKAGTELTGYELSLHYICPSCRSRTCKKQNSINL